MPIERVPGSFRDPAGFVFTREGVLYRQIDRPFGPTWDEFVASGLHADLVEGGLLIPVQNADRGLAVSESAHCVVRPERVSFISYPYEWSFSQLQDAALLTLDAMKRAMAKGFWMRDASGFNVQFHRGKAVLIDSLSFEPYREGHAWPAYGQFCRHFLAPLALAAHVDLRSILFLRLHIDGMPLDLAARMLPRKTKWNPGLLTHIHLHASAGTKTGAQNAHIPRREIPRNAILGLIDSLERSIRALAAPKTETVWGDYYNFTNYEKEAFERKKALVQELTEIAAPERIWDLGANTGVFSEAVAGDRREIVAWDGDPLAVEAAYLKWKKEKRGNLLPLLQDFSNPSPALGWAHRERNSLLERGPADLTLALALIHHLAIGNNVPLPLIAEWLTSLGKWCLIEFVPKADSQIQRMLANREDIFDDYDEVGFRRAFAASFELVESRAIEGTERTLFLYRRREDVGRA